MALITQVNNELLIFKCQGCLKMNDNINVISKNKIPIITAIMFLYY